MLESLFNLELHKDIESYDKQINNRLRAYLKKKTEKSKRTLTFDGVDEMVSKEPPINVKDTSAGSRIENLSIKYYSLLCRHGLL